MTISLLIEFYDYHYRKEAHDKQRMGQRFVNMYIAKPWPELFYETNNQKCSALIENWLTQHNYSPNNFPSVIDHAFLINKQHRQFEREHINTLTQLSKVKGERGGLCNRSACLAPGAYWFNRSTRAHYCNECARDINLANFRDSLALDGIRDLCSNTITNESEEK